MKVICLLWHRHSFSGAGLAFLVWVCLPVDRHAQSSCVEMWFGNCENHIAFLEENDRCWLSFLFLRSPGASYFLCVGCDVLRSLSDIARILDWDDQSDTGASLYFARRLWISRLLAWTCRVLSGIIGAKRQYCLNLVMYNVKCASTFNVCARISSLSFRSYVLTFRLISLCGSLWRRCQIWQVSGWIRFFYRTFYRTSFLHSENLKLTTRTMNRCVCSISRSIGGPWLIDSSFTVRGRFYIL